MEAHAGSSEEEPWLYDADGWVPEDQAALLKYQLEWYYDRSPVKVGAKSRQIGLTWTTALEAVEVAGACQDDGGMDVFFMSVGQEHARQFIDDCAEWIRWLSPVVSEAVDDVETQESEDWFVDDAGKSILAYRIDFPSGFRIYALPSRPARLRGQQGYAICDEAAQQDLEAWKKAAGGLLVWGGRLAYISTYDGVDNDFYKLVEDVKASSPPIATLHEVDIYKAVEQGLYRRICDSRLKIPWTAEGETAWIEWLRVYYGDRLFQEECECIVARGGGGLYPRELVRRCQVLGPSDCTIVEMRGGAEPRVWVDGMPCDKADDRWETDDPSAAHPDERAEKMRQWLDAYVSSVLASITADGFAVHAGLDYGRTRNLSTFVIGELRRDMRRRVRLVVELENMPWPEQHAVQDYMWERLPKLEAGCADGQGSGSSSAERCADRTRGKVRSVKILDGWHEPQFTALKKRLEEQSLELPRHFAPMLADMTSLRRKGKKIIAPQTVSKDGRKQKRHADSAYALALFEQSVNQDGPAGKKATRPYRSLRGKRNRR